MYIHIAKYEKLSVFIMNANHATGIKSSFHFSLNICVCNVHEKNVVKLYDKLYKIIAIKDELDIKYELGIR